MEELVLLLVTLGAIKPVTILAEELAKIIAKEVLVKIANNN